MEQYDSPPTDAPFCAPYSLMAAPAFAMGTIYQALASSTAMMFSNAACSQQRLNAVANAATAAEVALLLSVGSQVSGTSVKAERALLRELLEELHGCSGSPPQ